VRGQRRRWWEAGRERVGEVGCEIEERGEGVVLSIATLAKEMKNLWNISYELYLVCTCSHAAIATLGKSSSL
jgi:hypothetical protein